MIHMEREAFQGLCNLSKARHPLETVVLLRGQKTGEGYLVTEFLLPPWGFGSRGFASFNPLALPIDFSILGTAHTHPQGPLRPSRVDLQNFYGRIMMILGPPYDESSVAVYDKGGRSLGFRLFNRRL